MRENLIEQALFWERSFSSRVTKDKTSNDDKTVTVRIKMRTSTYVGGKMTIQRAETEAMQINGRAEKEDMRQYRG